MTQPIPKISSGADLREAINRLEIQQSAEAKILKEQFQVAYTSVKPINLIRNIFTEASESEEIKGKIASTTAGLAAGFISKVIFQGSSKNPVKKLIGTALMLGITNMVAKHPDTIRGIAEGVMKIFKRHKPKIPESAA
jgi:hypothetical protein